MTALVIAILVASALIVYYVTNVPSSPPSLSYDFTNPMNSSSILGWNTSAGVYGGATDAITIPPYGSMTSQFKALKSTAAASFNWTPYSGQKETMTMTIHRELKGTFSDLTYQSSVAGKEAYVYKATFNVDPGTLFTVKIAMTNETGYLYQVELWNSAQTP